MPAQTFLNSKTSSLTAVIETAMSGKMSSQTRKDAEHIIQAAVLDSESRKQLFGSLRRVAGSAVEPDFLPNSDHKKILKDGVSKVSDPLIMRMILSPLAICKLADEVADEVHAAWIDCQIELGEFLNGQLTQHKGKLPDNLEILPYAQASKFDDQNAEADAAFDEGHSDDSTKKKTNLNPTENPLQGQPNSTHWFKIPLALAAGIALLISGVGLWYSSLPKLELRQVAFNLVDDEFRSAVVTDANPQIAVKITEPLEGTAYFVSIANKKARLLNGSLSIATDSSFSLGTPETSDEILAIVVSDDADEIRQAIASTASAANDDLESLKLKLKDALKGLTDWAAFEKVWPK